jgi:predicted nucleotidyltransferase component of viral defense system
LRFRIPTEDKSSNVPIRVKVEVNFQEITAYEPPRVIPYTVTNPWFTGKADIATFSTEEILATKLRTLLQRDKGRDLIDLAHMHVTIKNLDARKGRGLLRQISRGIRSGHFARRPASPAWGAMARSC